MSFYIGNVKIDNKVVVAPMASITNTSFRKICKDMGAGLIVAEMVSDKAIMHDSKKTLDLLKMTDYERPISQQIFGSDIESFLIATKKIINIMNPDIIDINMGCPVPKVAIKNQAGSGLLKKPEKVKEIVSEVVKISTVPVTVKIRSGWDDNNINAVEIAKICEEAGAGAITVHARTRKQGYTGKADWNIIKEVVDAVSIPVIGNGDIKTPYDAKRMLDETGCTAIMIGRGLLGNPWLIKDTINYLEHNIEPKEVSLKEKKDMMLKHINLLYEDKPEKLATLELRTILLYYLKNVPNSKEHKLNIVKCKSREEYINIINSI